jgi:hypothetical protein
MTCFAAINLTPVIDSWKYYKASVFGISPIPAFDLLHQFLLVLKDISTNRPRNFEQLLKDLQVAYAKTCPDMTIDANGVTFILDATADLASRTIALPYVCQTTVTTQRHNGSEQSQQPRNLTCVCQQEVTTSKTEKEHMFTLNIPSSAQCTPPKMQDLIELHFTKQDNNTVIECSECHVQQTLSRTKAITSSPPAYLILHLQRKMAFIDAESGTYTNGLNRTAVQLDTHISISTAHAVINYTLTGFIVNIPYSNDGESGHYTTFVKECGSDRWIYLNDNHSLQYYDNFDTLLLSPQRRQICEGVYVALYTKIANC